MRTRRLSKIWKPPGGAPSVYSQDKNETYAGSTGGDATVIKVDRATFHVVSVMEARDKNHLYFEGRIVSENDEPQVR
jgi:hypothetical protein